MSILYLTIFPKYIKIRLELKAVDTDLHDMAEDYIPNYNIELIKNVLKRAKKEHELLKLYQKKDIIGKTVGAVPEFLKIHARIKKLEEEIK